MKRSDICDDGVVRPPSLCCIIPAASDASAYQAHSAQAEGLDWSNREAVIGGMVNEMRVLAGPAFPFDDAAAKRFVERHHDRKSIS